MPGQPELARSRHRRRDHAEVLGDQRQRAELAPAGVEEPAPGPRRQRPRLRASGGARGTAQ